MDATEQVMRYEVNVGMECHAELLTESKMFCGCANAFGGEPNTRTCPVCLGLPGSLPVMNRAAVEHVVRTALALNCAISPHSIFHRKNYFYPDLPKGYQISQYGDTPIGTNGWLEIEKPDGTTKRIRITRVHLEEDTGKSIHSDGAAGTSRAGYSVMDYNRSGVPLMEIVTAFPPDIEGAEEARPVRGNAALGAPVSGRFGRQDGAGQPARGAQPERAGPRAAAATRSASRPS
jgi:aspartyl-tRNA(Asn)/glutamyl-tRNA(Gln) amidotransferase subunit B